MWRRLIFKFKTDFSTFGGGAPALFPVLGSIDFPKGAEEWEHKKFCN